MKVGDTVWRFNVNRRVYTPAPKGRGYGEPIYREHWEPLTIIGETSRSWVVGSPNNPHKVPKKGPHPGWAYSEQEVDDACWDKDHRWKVVEAVRVKADVHALRSIAEMIGYKP